MRKAHFDFLVTDNSPSSRPLVAIEIDGPSLDSPKQQRRDALKDEICRLAELPLWRFGPLELPLDLIPSWIRHVFEVWKSDQVPKGNGGGSHPPVWTALEEVENCLTRLNHLPVSIEVEANELFECPVGPHTEGYAKVKVSVVGKIGSTEAATRGVPATDRMLALIAGGI